MKKQLTYTITGFALFGLFIATVIAAGSTVHLSYQYAQLQQREKIAASQIQVLQEKLAQAQSVETTLSYANTQGFISAGQAHNLSLSVPVAQR